MDLEDLEMSSRICVPYPEQFDICWPESWPAWVKYFERYLSLKKFTTLRDSRKIELLCYSMGPISEKILMRILPGYESSSYEIVKQTLNKYFTPHCNICNGVGNQSIKDTFIEFMSEEEKLNNRQKIYRYKIKNFSGLTDNQPFHYSPEFQLQQELWHLIIRKRICCQEQKFLSITLCPGSEQANYKFVGEVRLVSQDFNSHKAIIEKINHVFNGDGDRAEFCWESTHFMKWEEVFNPETGFVKDDSIILEVEIKE